MSDTSEITNGCLVHYDSSHIQTRRDFMGLCKYNREEFGERRKQEPNQECMAKIVRLIETLTDHAKTEWKLKALAAEEKGLRKPKEPKCYPITLTNGVIIRLIYETFGETIVRNSLNYLVEIGYIGREQEKKNIAPVVWLEQGYVQELLKAQAEVILAGFDFKPPSYQGAKAYPDGVISNPKAVYSRPGHSQAGSESTDDNIDNIGDNSHKKDKEGTYGANAPTPAHLKEQVDEEIEKVKTTSGRLRAMKGAAFNQGDVSDSQMDIGNDAEEETKPRVPAVRLQAVAAGQAPSPLDAASRQTTVSHTPGTPPRPLAAGTADVSSRHGDADSRQASRSLLLDPEPAQADFPPAGSAASGTTTAQAMGRRSTVPRRPKGKPAVLELTLAGMDVKSWYEQVRGKLRMTERNVNDCNALGECDGIELESLRVYFEHVEALKWVKQYGVVIDLATAAGTTGNDKLQFLSFESNWPLVKKKLQLEQRKNSDDEVADDDYSPAGILKLHEQRERKQAQERGV